MATDGRASRFIQPREERKFIATNLDTTRQIGGAIAQLIDGPVSIALNGTLGAGKTALAKSIISALGVEIDSIASPTFTICQEHDGQDWTIYHVDLYRVVDEDELMELGFEEWLDGDGISIIEWADRFSDVNFGCDLQINISVLDDDSREFLLRVPKDSNRFLELSTIGNG